MLQANPGYNPEEVSTAVFAVEFDQLQRDILSGKHGIHELRFRKRSLAIKIAKDLQKRLNDPGITAAITSEDPTEFDSGDWIYPPIIEVCTDRADSTQSSRVKLGQFYPYIEGAYEQLVREIEHHNSNQPMIEIDGVELDVDAQGFVSFGDVARGIIGQHVIYASKYINGGVGNYPNLGEGLRFLGNPNNYNGLKIHKDDIREFVARILNYREELRNKKII